VKTTPANGAYIGEHLALKANRRCINGLRNALVAPQAVERVFGAYKDLERWWP